MKVVYTEKEIEGMIEDHLRGLAPVGRVTEIRYDKYSGDYCTVTFEQATTETPVTPIDDKPIDLSEIPF